MRAEDSSEPERGGEVRSEGAGRAAGLVVSAPASGCGKTLVTLGLLRALAEAGHRVSSFKVGPDFIDPAFHRAASGVACVNLDPWAMRARSLRALAARASEDATLLVGEGMMGLFDGAGARTGSTADLAATLGLPVLLVVDVSAQAASAAAVVHGFRTFRSDVDVAGVILNRVASPRHAELLLEACAPVGVAIVGTLASERALEWPERHLGLVQACEAPDLERFVRGAAAAIRDGLDLGAVARLARPLRPAEPPDGALRDGSGPGVPRIGRRISVASDLAFQFAYPALLDAWRAQGAEVALHSPLADEPPDASVDAVYLPGGYPELHAARLARAHQWKEAVRTLATRGAVIYGECGGYMVLGRAIVDARGDRHDMLGLLDLETSFAPPAPRIGYRELALLADGPLGPAGARLRGHEFHHARIVGEPARGEALFRARDASGVDLGPVGARRGRVFGSFMHLIDRAE